MAADSSTPPPQTPPLRIAYLTAGAAGMICGSCLNDNTLARALMELGHDVQLVPLYTPIRVDDEDVSGERIFYGGINMYLQQKSRLFRWLPKWMDGWLDQKWLIEWAAGRSVKIDPVAVADLALSILRGTAGFQKKEVERLADWLTGEFKPDVIVFSNMLTAGCVPEVKRRLNVPVVVTLQGDDIFLRGMPQPQQGQALAEIARLATSIDGFIAHSRFYADAMAEFLTLPRERVSVVPLGVEVRDFLAVGRDEADKGTRRQGDKGPVIGYLARLAPEKGLHVLGEAFVRLRQMAGMERARLRVAGWLGEKNRDYVEEVFQRLRDAGSGEAFEYLGEVDRKQKLEFLAAIDVLAVPTTYQEPKGLFVLEALAAGVPVLAPEHGAFPELLGETQGGLMHRPEDPQHLAERLFEVLCNPELQLRLAEAGRSNVHIGRNARTMAAATVEVLRMAMARAEER